MANFSLQGHSALITGSSTGIGQGIAAAMLEAGAKVVLHGMDERAQREDLQTQPYCQVDLLAEGGCEKLLNDAFAHEPSIDLLVCNVGGFFDVPFLDMSKKIWDKTMRLNVESAYFLIQEFSRKLVAQKRAGSVVITSSTNGFQAEFDSTAYDTSKGALVMMTRSIALSLAEHGIRVNGLAPGFIRTPLTSAGLAAVPGLQDTLEKKIAMGRIGEADDCAGAAVFLSSPAASYITGHVLIVDGGLSIGQLPRI